MTPPRGSSFVRNVGVTLVGRYGTKAFEALIYMVAMRTVPPEKVGLVFLASASSAVAYRAIDLGLYPVMARSSARRELDDATYGFLVKKRAVLLAFIAVGFFVYSLVTGAREAWIVSAFFASDALPLVHELPRAVMFGHERFDALARLNLGSKAIEAAFAAIGMALGFGLGAWLLGRVVAHGVFFVVATRLAKQELEAGPPSNTRPLHAGLEMVRHGSTFWLRRLVDTATYRVGAILVATKLGLAATAQLGLAGKIQATALTLVGVVAQVAYPRIAREPDRTFPTNRVGTLIVIALLAGVGVFAVAPLLVRVLVGHADPVMASLVRALAPSLAFITMSGPLQVWLEAKGEERRVLVVATMNAAISVVATYMLVMSNGLLGAGEARVVQTAFEAAALAIVVTMVVRRAKSTAS